MYILLKNVIMVLPLLNKKVDLLILCKLWYNCKATKVFNILLQAMFYSSIDLLWGSFIIFFIQLDVCSKGAEQNF